jgi:putative hemolysin
MYRQLEQYRVSPEFETAPTVDYACPAETHIGERDAAEVKVPRLLKTYLAIGARIAAPPAWDREFHTIDFLTLLDLKLLSASARNRFLAPLSQ